MTDPAKTRAWRALAWRALGEACVVALVGLLMYELKDNLNPSTVFEQHFIPPLPAAIAAAAVLIVAARRYPRCCAVAAPLLAAYLPIAAPMLAVVTYRVASRRVMRTWLLLILAVVVPVVCGVAASFPWGMVWVWDTVNVLVTISVTCAVLPMVAAGVLNQRERLLEALRGRTDALERSRRVSDAAARLAERNRIAKEMHDAIGHRLSLISLYSGSLQLSTEKDPQLHGQAALVQDSASAASRELREVLGVLTTAGDSADNAETAGTRGGVTAMIDQSRAAGIEVEFSWDGDDLNAVRPVVRQAVHRVIQECLTNVHRHAAGSRALVTVTVSDEDVRVEAVNGPDATRRGDTSGSRRGLVGLRERVEILGGQFTAGPSDDGGFAVAARIPRTSRKVEPGTIDPDGAGRPLDSAPPSRFAALRQRVGIPAVLTLGLVAVSALFAFTLLVVPAPQVPDSSLDDLVAPGMPRGDVEAILGHSDELVATLAGGQEPNPPSGSRSCWYRVMGDDGGPRITVWRLCFVRDLLSDDTTFKVRVGQ